MASPLIDTCRATLQLPPGGLPGMVAPTTLDRFELLQTPGLWGHDPTDNSYWLAAEESLTPLPAASRRGLARAARQGKRPTVRILYGRHGYAREGFVY